ncbi:hypothetical protein ACOTVP_08715 [Aliarcobacter butzleri]
MFKVLDEVCEPKRSTKYSAYVDLFSAEDIIIGAGETKIVKLGVKLDLEKLCKILYDVSYSYILKSPNKHLREDFDIFRKKHYLEVALRSSLGVKGLIIANGIGVIDLDYPDEIGLIVHNPIKDIAFNVPNGNSFKISKGDKVAQCTLKEHKGFLMGYESDNVRVGGFGSTDKESHISNILDDLPDYFKCNELN